MYKLTFLVLVFQSIVGTAFAERYYCAHFFQFSEVVSTNRLFTVVEKKTEKEYPLQDGHPNDRQVVLVNESEFLRQFEELAREYPSRVNRTYLMVNEQESVPIFTIDKSPSRKNILISSGVHGNEGLGVIASLDLARNILRRSAKNFDELSFTIVPIVNPEALKRGVRKVNNEDFNRQFSFITKTNPIVNAIMKWIMDQNIFAHIDNHQAPLKSHSFIIRHDRDDTGIAERSMDVLPEHEKLVVSNYQPYLSKKSKYKQSVPGVVSSSNEGTFKAFTHNLGAVSMTFELPGRYHHHEARTIYQDMILSTLFELNTFAKEGSRKPFDLFDFIHSATHW